MRYKDLLKKRNELSGKMRSPDSPIVSEDFIVGEMVIGVGGKENEIEKLYSTMERFSDFGHGLLTIEEEHELSGEHDIMIKDKNIGKIMKDDCIAPSDHGTFCWDLNQQIGIKSFDECFECQVYQGPEVKVNGDKRDARFGDDTVGDEARGGEFMYEAFVTAVKEIYRNAGNNKKINLEVAKGIAAKLVDKVPGDNKLLWQAINARRGSQLASHVLNVAIFSVKVGHGLKYSQEEQLLLTLASILHDLGMTKVSLEVIGKKEKLTRSEYDMIKKHPHYSMELIRNSVSGNIDAETERLIRIVGEEHERENGSGYPAGKSSDEIDEIAKVIGVLDVFEALSHERGHRNEYSSFQAIQVIIQMRNEFFSNKVVKAVITEISIFPLESYVKLNNGEVGRVVKTNFAHPMRPVIEIVRDSKGNKNRHRREVNLAENPLIFITKPVGEEEA